jgi:hypothetical protein
MWIKIAVYIRISWLVLIMSRFSEAQLYQKL